MTRLPFLLDRKEFSCLDYTQDQDRRIKCAALLRSSQPSSKRHLPFNAADSKKMTDLNNNNTNQSSIVPEAAKLVLYDLRTLYTQGNDKEDRQPGNTPTTRSSRLNLQGVQEITGPTTLLMLSLKDCDRVENSFRDTLQARKAFREWQLHHLLLTSSGWQSAQLEPLPCTSFHFRLTEAKQ